MLGDVIQKYGPTTLLIAIAVLVWTRFDWVDQRFDAIDQRFDAVDRRFDAVDQRLIKLEDGQSALRKRTAIVETRMGSMEQDLTLIKVHLVPPALERPLDPNVGGPVEPPTE